MTSHNSGVVSMFTDLFTLTMRSGCHQECLCLVGAGAYLELHDWVNAQDIETVLD